MIIQKTSPNFGSRNGTKIDTVFIHIMAGTLIGTDSWFANPASQVSAHYGIGLNGEIHQYIKETDRAWHAGNENSRSIGIEHEGYDLSKAPLIQLQTSANLLKEICTRWDIPIDRAHVKGHYEVKPTKPNCPATDKSVIDKIIALTKPVVQPKPNPSRDEIKKKIIELLNIL